MNFKIFNKNNFRSLIKFSVFLLLAVSCKKETENPVSLETGFVTDIENSTYKTVKIGNQWWMAENLNVKRFRNGDLITQAQSDNSWIDTVSAFCIYDNNNESPGLLYNWFAVNDSRKIAPAGWHIPTDNEWKELEKYLGMSESEADKKSWRGTNEGEKLRIEENKGWTSYPNVWATNESGFTALAGGCRLFNGIWGSPGLFSTGFWWSCTGSADQTAWYRYMDYKSTKIFRHYAQKNYGFSIRCVKDN